MNIKQWITGQEVQSFNIDGDLVKFTRKMLTERVKTEVLFAKYKYLQIYCKFTWIVKWWSSAKKSWTSFQWN